MRYDFDRVIDRSGDHSMKYDDREKVFGNPNVIPLWIADMDFQVAEPITNALLARARMGIFGYTSRPDSYFKAMCDFQYRHKGWSIDPALVSHALGVVPALSGIVHCFTKDGDGVLIQPPVYPHFYDAAEAWDRKVVVNDLVEHDGSWSIDFDDFEKKLDEVTIFILCSPHNPIGKLWTREELTRMAELCLRKHVLVVSDEIHSDLVYFGKKHIPMATLSDEIAANTVTCVSATKTFNIAGLQACQAVFPNLKMKQRFDDFWAGMDIVENNAFSVVAMEAAYNSGDEWLSQLLPYLEGNLLFIKDYFDRYIPRIKADLPEATYLVWLDCRDLGMSGDELCRFMAYDAGLGLNDGRTFSRTLEGFMRLNAACPRGTLERALSQLRAAVNSL